MLSFATGTSSFEKIRKDTNKPIYIDKTDLIYEIFSSSSAALLFTRPIRFMKSTNLNMIASFCDIQKREENAVLFDGLSIRNFSQPGRETIWSNHFGQYPVIFLSFANITPGDGEHILKQFKDIIVDLYEKHEYLLDSPELSRRKKAAISNILNLTTDLETFQKSLKFLSECLNAHYKRPAVILIDEYDTPLHHAQIYDETHDSLHVQDDFSTHETSSFKKTLDFMLAFLKPGLKDNPNLHKGIMTGVLRTAFGSLVSTLNNVDIFSMLDQSNQYAPYFGVTENDIEYLLNVIKIEDHQEKIAVRDKLRGAYNGYTIAGVVLYNPWSVMKYLSTYVNNRLSGLPTEAMSYWLATGNSSIIGIYLRKYFSDIVRDIETLLRLEPLNVSINERSTFADAGMGAIAAFWGMLLQCGYLTVISKRESIGAKSTYTLRIPNNEVYGAFINHLDNLLVPETLSQEANNRFTNALLRHDFDNFTTYLKEYLGQVVSYFDIQRTSAPEAHLVKRKKRRKGTREEVEKTGDKFLILPEMVFHVLLMGVIAGLHQVQYLVHSNREAGGGRYDLLLLPRSADRPGIIFEFKKTDSSDELEAASVTALQQIHDRNYQIDLETYGVKQGIHIGIAFFGKELSLRYERAVYEPTASFRLREPIGDYYTIGKRKRGSEQKSVFNNINTFYQSSVSEKPSLRQSIENAIRVWSWEIEDHELVEAKKASLASFYSEDRLRIFNTRINTLGFTLSRIEGDGNCFFRAVIDQIRQRYPALIESIQKITGAIIVDHSILRQLAVGALIDRAQQPDCPRELIDNLNATIQHQRRDGTWAEDVVISMMANVLGLTIVLVNSNEFQPISVISEGQQGIICLAYHEGTHFDSLSGRNPSEYLMQLITTRMSSSSPSTPISMEDAWNNVSQGESAAKFQRK
jgi:hypothetical protein